MPEFQPGRSRLRALLALLQGEDSSSRSSWQRSAHHAPSVASYRSHDGFVDLFPDGKMPAARVRILLSCPSKEAPMKLAGRVAVITGGGHGLGRDIALGFADAGADLSLCGTNAGVLESTAAELRARGRRVVARVADV